MRKKVTVTAIAALTLTAVFGVGSLANSDPRTQTDVALPRLKAPISLSLPVEEVVGTATTQEVQSNPIQFGPESVLNPIDLKSTTPYTFDQETLRSATDYVDTTYSSWRDQNMSIQDRTLAAIARVKSSDATKVYLAANAIATEKNRTADESALAALAAYRHMKNSDVGVLGPSLAAFIGSDEEDDYDDFISSYNALNSAEKITQSASVQANEDSITAADALTISDTAAAEASEQLANAEAKEASSVESSQTSQTLALQAEDDWATLMKTINKNNYASVAVASTVETPSPATVLPVNTVISNWNSQLALIKDEGIVPPLLASLTQEADIRAQGLQPVYDSQGNLQPGVALSPQGNLVLASESIARVNYALSSLLVPYDANGVDGTLSCQAFASKAVASDSVMDLPTLYQSAQQNTNMMDAYPGDIVFSGDTKIGLHQAGVHIGGGFVVVASASTGYVSLERLGYDTLLSIRPGVAPSAETSPAPERQEGAADWNCGGIANESSTSTDLLAWLKPFTDDGEITTAYGQEDGSRFASWNNVSFGLGYSAVDDQTPVRSATTGLVISSETDEQLGEIVRVRYSDLLTITYSGMSVRTVTEGNVLNAGDFIGLAGSTGEAMFGQAPGVMVKVEAQDVAIDPTYLFNPIREAFSEYSNGQIPASSLCEVGVGGHLLRCDAARAFSALSSAYQAAFGKEIQFTDTYRSYEGQLACTAAKGRMCATPGTSNHGWGLAIDFADGINVFGTPEHEWMRANAASFGWYHPDWAQSNGSKPEAWHWEYTATQQ